MTRTTIDLTESQTRLLDEVARSQGMSRAALIRRLIDRGLDQRDGELESDLSAIEDSFGVLSSDEGAVERGIDERTG